MTLDLGAGAPARGVALRVYYILVKRFPHGAPRPGQEQAKIDNPCTRERNI